MAIREQSFHQRLVGHRLDLPAIARRAEASRLLQVDQPVGLPGLGQTLRGAAHLFKLVAAVGDQQQWIGAAALLDQDRAVAGQALGLDGVEHHRPVALGDHQAGQLPPAAVDRR